jgi:hypothetical protein
MEKIWKRLLEKGKILFVRYLNIKKKKLFIRVELILKILKNLKYPNHQNLKFKK